MTVTITRSASVLLTDEEADAIRRGLGVIYRPIKLHWDQQFDKFTREPETEEPEPQVQVTLFGSVVDDGPSEVVDVVHLMVDTGTVVRDDDGRVVKDGNGQPRTHKRRVETRVLIRVTDEAVFPETFAVKAPHLVAGEPCWMLVLGEKVS